MKIKSWGGQVKNREFYYDAEIRKKSFERFNVLGPFKIGRKRFVAVAYFDKWSYWDWFLRHGIIYLISFFYSDYYLKTKSLATRTKGAVILDDNADPVSDKKLRLRVAKVALAWIDVYLSPVFSPKLLKWVDMKAKLNEKIFEQCKNRKISNSKTLPEKVFFQELRKADEQVIKFYPIFVKYHSLLKNATNLLYQVSNKPSEANVTKLKSVISNLALRFGELANWCEERAKSWPVFVDSYEVYKKLEERKKSWFERYGPRLLWEVVLSVVAYIISAGNFAFSIIFKLISFFGVEGFKIILSFRWQTKMLNKAAGRYRMFSNRAKMFLDLFNLPSRKDFIR